MRDLRVVKRSRGERTFLRTSPGIARSSAIVLTVAAVLFSLSTPLASATVKVGATCVKVGQTTTVSGIKYSCLKSGSKLVWKAAPSKHLTIGLLIPQGDQYFQSVKTGLEVAVKKDGGKVITVNTNNDAGAEATAVQNLIQRKVDAILMQPATSTAGSIATMKTVRASGITLICYGNCSGQAASPTIVKGVVQSDNTALGTGTGRAAATYIKAHLNGTATIGILNCDSFDVCHLRKAGFKKALADAGIIATYVADQEGYLADKATPIATNILSANPSINLMWSANEGGTEGEVTAIKASGKTIPVFGTDISAQLAQMLADPDNILQASTGQDGAGTAVKAYVLAKNAINKKVNKPLEVDVPGATYSRTNMAGINKYLGK